MRLSLLLATTISLATVSIATHRSARRRCRARAFASPRTGCRAQPAAPKRAVASFWTSPEPTFDEGTYDRINAAMLSYSAIEVRGGWPMLAEGEARARRDGRGCRQAARAPRDHRRSSGGSRRGRQPTTHADRSGEALPVATACPRPARRPADHRGAQRSGNTRIRQLAASLDRLHGMGFTFGQRYVVVNIPAAVAEAVEDGKVTRRYVTVVGKVDRPSPTLTTQITAVNLNPTWTVPLSILKKDIVSKMRKDPGYVGRMQMRVLDARQRGRSRARSTGSRTARRTSRCGRIRATATRSATCASTCRTRIRSTCTTPITRNSSARTIASSRPAVRA